MENKRKKDFCLFFAAVLLLVLGAAGLVFAADGSISVSSVSVQASSGGSSTTAALSLITDGNITTAGIETNAYLDSNITITFDQNVATGSSVKSKINLQKLDGDGNPLADVLITNNGILISGNTITINPTDNLSANTCYLATVGQGVAISDNSVATTVTYQAIFKTGTDSTPAPPSTTFSAIMTSPAITGNTVNGTVDKNSAVFTFAFSEIVKNNGLTGNGVVTLTKVSGGSAAVASDGAVLASSASTTAGSNIYLATLGNSGNTSAAFTINPSILEPSATYRFTISSAAASNTTPAKTLGADQVYTFTTGADTTPTTTLEAIYLYPSANAKDVAIDTNFVIGFTKAINTSNNITNGKAIELVDTATNATLPAIFTLNSDAKSITVDPTATLNFGKQYGLRILNGKIGAGTELLSSSSITFNTTCFSQVTASAITSGSGLDISVNLTNASSADQAVYVAYVVRRDKGARLEDGGIVAYSNKTGEITCSMGSTVIPLNIADISLDQFGNALSRSAYVDLYILDSGNHLLYNPVHFRAQ